MKTANAPLIEVDHVSKAFCRDLKRALWYGLKDITGELSGQLQDRSTLRRDEFWALNDVSFQVRRGECVGLIGRNGAGKTSLLRLLNGLVRPDSGQITMRGRIGALIALGAGFNPILTGRENVYINGSVLGLSKREIDAKLEEIIDFAEVRDAIDAPVQTYSSGMKVRLGFSIATTMEPDVLLIDEVLAVGDKSFRTKCYNRIGEVVARAAVIIVSHDMNSIQRLCDRVLLMNRGTIAHLGDVVDGVKRYEELNTQESQSEQRFLVFDPDLTLDRIALSQDVIRTGQPVSILLDYTSKREIEVGLVDTVMHDSRENLVAQYRSNARGDSYHIEAGSHRMTVPLGPIPLTSGKYVLNCGAYYEDQKRILFNAIESCVLEVHSNFASTAIVELGA
ncbi:polysaccharide ABC transporter ATP-binding protein (plasmid) [Tundrisphaera lichenicola]|uniref:ABC transporter ATP-binding protein n=1 Tax=Tundrisphaera lichenicola TaxID=2029860 RepID=UPI003EBC5A8C